MVLSGVPADGFNLDAWQRAYFAPFVTSLWLGAVVCLMTLPITLLWLEWGPSRFNAVLYLLIVPALPPARPCSLLRCELDGTAWGLVWSHLLGAAVHGADANRPVPRLRLAPDDHRASVGPFAVASLFVGQVADAVQTFAGGTGGRFAVSIAQYLPTLFAGGEALLP